MSNRIFLSLLLVVALFTSLSAQIFNPVSWSTKTEALGNNEFKLSIIAQMDDGWAVYSQFTADEGPVPTSINWELEDHFELIGKTTEKGHKKEGFDDLFGVEVIKFLSDQDLVFTQRVKLLGQAPIEVALEYMACDHEQCLPPTEEYFTFTPEYTEATAQTSDQNNTTETTTSSSTIESKRSVSDATPSKTQVVAAEKVMVDKVANTSTNSKTFSTESADTQPQTTTQAEEEDNFAGSSFSVSEPAATTDDPVTWSLKATQIAADEYEIVAKAIIEKDWTLYGYQLDPAIGPIPTAFIIDEDGLSYLNNVEQRAAKRKVVYEEVWEADVPKLYDEVAYAQKIKLAPGTERVSGTITYMACKEVCLPPEDIPFSLDLTQKTASIGYDGGSSDSTTPAATTNEANTFKAGSCDLNFDNVPAANCNIGATEVKGKGLLSIFGLGFLGGLFALLMPCIFPMIPLTVNFFNKGGSNRIAGIKNAGLYGFFIFAIYVLLSLPFHLIEGISANILNDVASNVPLNIFFFAVFMFFAGSFFGYYELTLPSSWTNSSAKKETSGGIVGIFFMALTLALVSFSCTGPILGSLLVGTASEGAMPLTAGMAGFGLALALPFTLFAGFPQLLKSMPSSGGWLNSVKIVLGFLEVALAFKFLSTADLVGKWGFLKIELFYGIWIICFIGIALYLLRVISFPHDSKNRSTSVLGYMVAAGALAFAGYLGTGFKVNTQLNSYDPLSMMSGLAPPVCHSFLYPCECPQGIPCFKDLEEGLAYACEVNKPVMLDFTGLSCTNCRDMEENVWSKNKVRNTLSKDFVLISLYVDDRTPLPESEHIEVDRLDRPGKKKKIDKVGKKWHHLEQSVYEKTTQPYYVLISPDGKTLNPPVAYTPNVDEYAAFLECGLSTYKERYQTAQTQQ